MRRLPDRAAAEVAPYRFDFHARLMGDPITGARVTANGGLIVRDVVFNATQVDFWLMGGSGGESALIACAVTTASGRQDLCQAEILTRA